jgi:flagellin-like hook-associated protein FlgL
MSFSIQTNVNSLVAQENLRVNSNFQSQTIQRLTSGYRINSSADDAAGLAIANKFRNDTAELSQGVRNANDGVSQLQIMDGGMNNISKMLDRLKTLATQSASDSFTGDRNTLNSEYQTLIGEINRQAQAIGLNQGGGFAKSLSVYLGGGAGSSAAATLANGSVSINLSKSTVDAQSLGLQGVQAANSKAYDLGGASTTSVQKILSDAGNGAPSGGSVASTTFKFFGAGYANDVSGVNNGISVTVNLNGVGDTSTLVDAINAGIQTAANQSTGAAAAFKAANITASVVTDANGNQKLAFTSANSSFEAEATDRTSNALMGNLGGDGTTAATGAQMGTTVDARGAATAAGGAAWNFSAASASVQLTVSGAGMSSPKTVTLNTDYSVIGSYATVDAIAADITTKLGVTGLTVSNNGGTLRFTSTAGAVSISATSQTAGSVGAMGLNATATANGTSASAGAAYSDVVASGSYEMGNTSGSAANFTWAGAIALNTTQAVTVSANDASGTAHAKTISLANATTGASLGAAVAALNDALQKSDDSTLQQVTAVAVNDNGVQKINFVSTLSSFSVTLGTVGTGTTGIKDGSGNQGSTTQAAQIGSSTAGDISSASGAKSAVAALTAAVSHLGTAQAVVGKGQNQLSYAIGLAQSQISNFSAAQSQIRDADVAAEAANLTKASVLQQASIAAMAQANSAPQAVLSLLRG